MKKDKVTVIIQARLGSTRLPGKMLMDLCGQPVVHWVIERVKKSKKANSIILATTDNPIDDPLVDYVEKMGVNVFRGGEYDVLQRFISAATTVDTDIVVRVCADNPLVDPDVLDFAVSTFQEIDSDYIYNHIPKNNSLYPDGLGVEVVGLKTLKDIKSKATDKSHLEHVTSYIWDNKDSYNIQAASCPEKWRENGINIKLDIDTQYDLENMRLLCRHVDIDCSAEKVISTWRSVFFEINAVDKKT